MASKTLKTVFSPALGCAPACSAPTLVSVDICIFSWREPWRAISRDDFPPNSLSHSRRNSAAAREDRGDSVILKIEEAKHCTVQEFRLGTRATQSKFRLVL